MKSFYKSRLALADNVVIVFYLNIMKTFDYNHGIGFYVVYLFSCLDVLFGNICNNLNQDKGLS